ncbi:hypothetical protein EGR_04893 [Echinococcus granulosus]|uniref:Uncharacterized protein n=1 Tax=Echinococcus granulosus TaxID=6210 RepID=W6UGS3_ECHGR|nr:hypothetical protein EGR_04893 [Echinococcus granulosus]EUB60183.1 hypothetical protein EGR_04893 [Echinococcus granulosus]
MYEKFFDACKRTFDVKNNINNGYGGKQKTCWPLKWKKENRCLVIISEPTSLLCLLVDESSHLCFVCFDQVVKHYPFVISISIIQIDLLQTKDAIFSLETDAPSGSVKPEYFLFKESSETFNLYTLRVITFAFFNSVFYLASDHRVTRSQLIVVYFNHNFETNRPFKIRNENKEKNNMLYPILLSCFMSNDDSGRRIQLKGKLKYG